MEVTSNLDAPQGWRTKMAAAEEVDAGITFTNGLSAGYISVNRYQNAQKNGRPNNTRVKQIPYLKANIRSGLPSIRKAGTIPGQLYN